MSIPSEPTDLRTLAAEALEAAKLLCESPQAWHAGMARDPDPAGRVTAPCGDCLAASALAAVLPTHRATVLAEAVSAIEAHRLTGTPWGDARRWSGRQGGLEDAVHIVRRLAATAPPAVPEPTVGSGDHPVVPEEGVGRG